MRPLKEANMDDKIAAHLAQEYLFLQKVIEDFDARALTIKAWSVTFSAVRFQPTMWR